MCWLLRSAIKRLHAMVSARMLQKHGNTLHIGNTLTWAGKNVYGISKLQYWHGHTPEMKTHMCYYGRWTPRKTWSRSHRPFWSRCRHFIIVFLWYSMSVLSVHRRTTLGHDDEQQRSSTQEKICFCVIRPQNKMRLFMFKQIRKALLLEGRAFTIAWHRILH